MKRLLVAVAVLIFLGSLIGYGSYKYIVSTLPQLITVDDYEPLLVSQVYDRNGKKIGEFSRERRVLLPYKEIPKDLVHAFLAAEDDQFFQHKGINYIAILRATFANMRAGRTVQGGSTITQQVAKTLLLSSEKTILRKVKDALLAIEMEEHLSKEDILYLYLNQIYFGQSAYGIALAAETYFRKPVQKLNLAEIAILAGLPKAPSAYSPVTNPNRAKERQVYVLNRMAEVGFITQQQADAAAKETVKVFTREKFEEFAPFFLEAVRLLLRSEIGEDIVLDKGLKITTSLDLDKQRAAQEAVIANLKDLDKRQGYRGPLRNITEPKEVGEFLMTTRNKLINLVSPEKIIQPDGNFIDPGPLDLKRDIKKGLPHYMKIGTTAEAVVSKVDDDLGLVYVRIAELEGIIDFETMAWARKPNQDKRHDLDQIKKPSQALKMGDVILAKVTDNKFTSARVNKILTAKKMKSDFSKYITLELDQEPIAEAALLSFDQQTQEVIAMVGGYKFEKNKNEYNRALQAARQTGSSFKAIVYASALDKGYTPATPVMDAPIVVEEGGDTEEGQGDEKIWRPSNHSKSFGGDILFRNALVKSLNIPTVKIIEDIKVNWAAEYAQRLGVFSKLNYDFTLALGSSSLTLYEMTKVFSEFGRLGKRIKPIIIKKVEDRQGKKIAENLTLDLRYQKESEEIENKFEERRKAYLEELKTKPPEEIEKDQRIDKYIFFNDPDQLMRPTTAYLTTTLLKAVIEDRQGTGARAKALGREVAGKTGSSNGYFDAWFIGYSPQIATGVWVGFDQEKSLGKGEVGGRSALPIWVDYMKAAHEELPQMTFPVPEGIVFANIDGESGQLASSNSKNIIRQAFLEGTEPTSTKSKKEEDTDFLKQDLSE
jgi:penicillin-binding protein 1A